MATINELVEQINHNLENHAPLNGDVISTYERIRGAGKHFGHVIAYNCPPSRELSLAITNLEQTVMWAIASIARDVPREETSVDENQGTFL